MTARPPGGQASSAPPVLSQASSAPPVLFEVVGPVARLTLNRPAQFNALTAAMIEAMTLALRQIADEPAIRVVVVAANGRAFCAGHDLHEVQQAGAAGEAADLFARCSRMMQALTAIPQPVIARVHGMATAAGCQLVAACDLAVAAQDAQFAVSGVNLGLFCATPGVALSRNVSRKQAFEMLVTGDFIDASTALARGLVNRVVLADLLDAEVARWVQAILAKPAVAIATGKRLFYRQLEMGLAAAYQLAGQTMACNLTAPATQEGIDAFLAKRRPDWSGGAA